MSAEEWQDYCIYNNTTGVIVDSGYLPVSQMNSVVPTDSDLFLLETDDPVSEGEYWIDDHLLTPRERFNPDWAGSTLNNCPSSAEFIVHTPSGQFKSSESLQGVVHLDCVESGTHRVHINAWPYLEWIGEIEPSSAPDNAGHMIEVVAHSALSGAMLSAINEVKAAARRAQGRIYTNGKEARYKEKHNEVLRWRASGDPDPLMADYPYAAGYAVAQDITLIASLELIEAKAAETITNGAAIENYEDSAKAEIQAATTFKQIHVERDFYIAMLDQL